MDNKYLNHIFTAFPIVVLLVLLIWFLNQYKTNELKQVLLVLKIKQLEGELNLKVTKEITDEVLNQNPINKAINKLQVI